MPLITAINPRKKTRATGKKKGPKKEMAKTKALAKRKRRKSTPKTIIKYRTRKNPSKTRRLARRAGAYGKQTLLGVNVQGAIKSTVPLLLGALACKFAAKKFADGGADGENWTWKNYAFGLVGGFVVAFGCQAVFKTKAGTTQKILEGALLLIGYKLFVNELAPTNDSLETWFGGDDDDASEYLPEMTGWEGMGDIYQDGEVDYIQGEDGAWRPMDDDHRMPGGMGSTEQLEPPTAEMGFTEQLEPPTREMGDSEDSFFFSEA